MIKYIYETTQVFYLRTHFTYDKFNKLLPSAYVATILTLFNRSARHMLYKKLVAICYCISIYF